MKAFTFNVLKSGLISDTSSGHQILDRMSL